MKGGKETGDYLNNIERTSLTRGDYQMAAMLLIESEVTYFQLKLERVT